jgi:hypothetical protein
MEKVKREVFETWAKKEDWLKIGEPPNSNGQQHNYLTPAGEFVIIQYNLQGELEQVIKPLAAPTQQRNIGSLPMDFRSGKFLPGTPPG